MISLVSEQQISICLSELQPPLTVHLDGEDALEACGPHCCPDAGLAQQAVVVCVLPAAQLHPAHLAGEAVVVPRQAVAQSHLLDKIYLGS